MHNIRRKKFRICFSFGRAGPKRRSPRTIDQFYRKIYFKMKSTVSTYISQLIFFDLPVIRFSSV